MKETDVLRLLTCDLCAVYLVTPDKVNTVV